MVQKELIMKKKYSQVPKQIKIIIVAFGLLILVAIIAALVTNISRIDKVAVTIKYAPFNSVVYLNGKKVKNDSVNYLKEGDYELIAELEHFTANVENININNETEYILGKLNPSDTEGEEIMASRQNDYLVVEGIHGSLLATAGDQVKQKYPILNHLPINNNFYSISYAYQEDNSPKITIKADSKYVDIAVKKLLSFSDINIVDYNIDFTITNPFVTPSNLSSGDPTETIKLNYQNIIHNYQIGSSTTIDNYYIATIFVHNSSTNDNYAHYKIILKKEVDVWKIVATPQLLFTKQNTPEVPTIILTKANHI